MLPKNLPFVIESGLVNSTNKKYVHGWKTWADCCNSKQKVDLCPADTFYVAIFPNYILFTSGKKERFSYNSILWNKMGSSRIRV